eukprot:TRINITY_DN105000_c0_g1_i1.p1 TRINITY_DN105000_c0_g1~~TRINITY_DN105000_c0_g1_i1.p1  ORF type:complete len:182 (+),score=7.69 TRINITY_DN105000_c0_g1_i1:47-592(+)
MSRSRSRPPAGGGDDAEFKKIQSLIDERNALRKQQKFQEADKVRDELRDMGVTTDDNAGTWTGPNGLSGQTGHKKGTGKGRARDRSASPRGGRRHDSRPRQRYRSPPPRQRYRSPPRRNPPQRSQRYDSRGRSPPRCDYRGAPPRRGDSRGPPPRRGDSRGPPPRRDDSRGPPPHRGGGRY